MSFIIEPDNKSLLRRDLGRSKSESRPHPLDSYRDPKERRVILGFIL